MRQWWVILLINCSFLASWVWLWPEHPYALLTVCSGLIVLLLTAYVRHRKEQQALEISFRDGLTHLLDGNFSVSVNPTAVPGYEDVLELFNRTAEKLRAERQHLYQRELLLDKVVNSGNVAMLIVNHRGQISFANRSVDYFTRQHGSIVGENWIEVQSEFFDDVETQLNVSGRTMFSQTDELHHTQLWHVSKENMLLHGMPHALYIFKPVTEEFARQEIKTWKKIIRVISHELNNSIAPISTMCHNGKLLSARLDEPHLDRVFNTISTRIDRLASFVKSYSDLAKQRVTQKVATTVGPLLDNVKPLYDFEVGKFWHEGQVFADPSQLEQVFINLLKNAHEAAPEGQVIVSIMRTEDDLTVSIEDNGPGIPAELMADIMVPFRSTKPNGSGIGLSVCQDLVDAHHGRLSLRNRPSGGIVAQVCLPLMDKQDKGTANASPT